MRIFLRILLVTAGAAVLATIAACGGGDDDATRDTTPARTTAARTSSARTTAAGVTDLAGMEDYFSSMQDIASATSIKLNGVSDHLNNTRYGTEQEELTDVRKYIKIGNTAIEDALSAIGDLDVPDGVESPNDDFVSALHDVLELDQQLLQGAQDADSDAELQHVVQRLSADQQAANTALHDACSALESFASDNGITIDGDIVDLACT